MKPKTISYLYQNPFFLTNSLFFLFFSLFLLISLVTHFRCFTSLNGGWTFFLANNKTLLCAFKLFLRQNVVVSLSDKVHWLKPLCGEFPALLLLPCRVRRLSCFVFVEGGSGASKHAPPRFLRRVYVVVSDLLLQIENLLWYSFFLADEVQCS